MRKFLPVMACAAGIATATAASAADPIIIPPPVVAVAPVAMADPGFNWSRF